MYKLTNNIFTIIRLSDGALIQSNPDDPEYLKYLNWCTQGNTPEPVDPPTDAELAKSDLEALERETMMNRGLREFLLVSMQDLAQRQSEQMLEQGIEMSPQDILASQSAWVKLVAINEKAIALRARIG